MQETAAPTTVEFQRLARKPESQARIVWRNFRRNRLAVAGGVVVILLYLVAIFATTLAPQDYAAFNRGKPLNPPSAEHWFGTDRQTRDVFSRVIVGSRVSLSVGLVSAGMIIVIGVTLGALAGYFGGLLDNLIMRFTDIMLAIPGFFLLLTAAALFKPGLQTTMIVIGLTSWMSTARLVRGEFLRVKAQDFILAARAIGAANLRIMVRHVLPNVLAVIIVQLTLWLSFAILLESGLSFLGLGAQPPTPSWGGMLADGRVNMQKAWWETVFPGMAIFLTVLSFNLVGDGLRDAFDPRQRRR
ncbi:ABC transporter permease [Sphaerobacter sp.]|uniref:ABC transporter permease n=1 Tax=Sphaerobacter sp. TaxID=2099654 RepID=UPI001D7CA250|nr:ABC transporter permease [Sphaerobacter sp.]MBX5444568.1 ABC transporter permease [Sphaerobacter sp.]